jgi:YidC/Oxa1 family membrane protein insertase
MFNTLFFQPLYNLLVILYHALGDNLGLAIIAIALVSRLVTLPLTLRQTKMTEKSREMSEKMKEVKKKYKNDKEKQQQEMMKIQSEYLPAQISGCLPLIVQFIFLIYIYKVIRSLISDPSSFNNVAYSFVPKFPENYVVNDSFLSGLIHLKETPTSVGTDDVLNFIPYLILVLAVGLTQFVSMKLMSAKQNTKKLEKEKEEKKKSDDTPDDFAEIMQQSTKQAMMLMPIMIMFGALSFPAGLSLYWSAQSIFMIIQQISVRFLPKNKEKVASN